jgi:phospholipid/cholesterol/gamma-HCH transport system substrate-binding protein
MNKISAEVRVGLIAVITIVSFIWLFSFLKGENLFSKTDRYTIFYNEVAGLDISSPVELNGYKAGVVHDVKLVNDGSGRIEVEIGILKDLKIPVGSIAEITTASLIAGMKIEMKISENTTYYKNGDTISGRVAVSILDKVETTFDPVMMKLDTLLSGIEKAVASINSIMTDEFIESIKTTGISASASSKKIETVISKTEASLPELVSSLNSFALMLKSNSENMENAIGNLSMVSDSLIASDIAGTINNLKSTLGETSKMLTNLNDGSGSAGLILTDDSLYINLANSLKSLDILLKDLKENPGEYVKFSLFGGKQK